MGRISLVDPQRAGGLAAARVALHWAAQIPAAAGTTLLEPREDYGHTNLGWSNAQHALMGRPLNDGGLSAGLRPSDFTLLVIEHDEEVSSLPLAGRTLEEGLDWLSETLALRGAAADGLERPAHDMPEHPVAEGAAFEAIDPGHLAQLAEWFAGADAALRRIVERREDASEIRCWPHHFDIATLITLEAGASPEDARTVGAGMTPGDASYESPYLYVTPWPYPKGDVALPPLPQPGRWHTEGWTGAVLLGTDLSGDEEATVSAFYDAAVAACEELAGA